ncbi:hypothetical protein EC973_004087 [Apophysomyces ossiformis]|uniref:Uncharacterized protein n=1 Tax=Apophysomyces ossiformis TaxID=679940 RepID=A0A8H7BQJ0_9FUNG|nr:hypothetical protein EC973_004087 [Apophysomyces ossiformis]
MPVQDDRTEMLAAAAKRTDRDQPGSDDLKQKLEKAKEKIRLMELELDKLRQENKTLHQLLESEVLSDQINLTFTDGETLGRYIHMCLKEQD